MTKKTIKKTKGVQIEIYHDATTSSGGGTSESDRAMGHYGGSKRLIKKTTRTIYELDANQTKDLLASKLIFSPMFKETKKELSLQEYISSNARNDSYNAQMKEYLSKDLKKRRYNFSPWFDPKNMSSSSISVVRLDGSIVYVDNLFYRSKYLEDFSTESPTKNEDVENTELEDYVLETDEISSFLPKIKNETILKIRHFSGRRTGKYFLEIKGFGAFSYKGESPSYIMGQTKYSVIESLLGEIKKYDVQNLDSKYLVKNGRVDQSKLKGENVEFSIIENGKLLTFLFNTSDKVYSENLVNLENFALELFKNIPDKR